MPLETSRFDNEPGIALMVAVLTMLFVSAIAAAVVLTTSSEALLGSGFQTAQQAFYSADAAAEWSVADLAAPAADWVAVAGGTAVSTFVDGPPSGGRTLGDGTTIDLGTIAASNPGWHLYAYGRLDGLLALADRGSQFYVVALVASDGASPDRLKVRSLAFGPRGAHGVVEIVALRRNAGVRVDSWLETR